MYNHPEPVPAASQLAVLPFVSAIDGYLRANSSAHGLRTTIHRTMNRESKRYLQQLCAYFSDNGIDSDGKVGRTFALNTGVMGESLFTRKIWRTKRYATEQDFRQDLAKDQERVKDNRTAVPLSYLAVPFVGPENEVVLILYADCYTFNFFANDEIIRCIVQMSRSFAMLMDWLESRPLDLIRNFPFEPGEPVVSDPTLYKGVQEALPEIPPPSFRNINFFNYEASLS